jgi:ribosomal protein S8
MGKNLAFLLSNIRVGFLAKKKFIISRCSLRSLECLELLYKLGYIYGYTLLENGRAKIFLKFFDNKSVIRNIFLLSKSSRKEYISFRVLKGALINNYISVNGFMFISTPYGILTDVEAVLLRTGGRPILFVC